MKKTYLIMYFFIFLFGYTYVYANGIGPTMDEYEVIVSNPNGAQLYNDNLEPIDRNANYKEKLEIFAAFYDKDILYGYTRFINDNDYKRYIVKLDDVTLIESSTDYEEHPDFGVFDYEEDTFYYILEDGVYLYSGPGFIYGKIPENIEVKKGQAVKALKYTLDFIYIEYGDKTGWIPFTANDTPKVGMIFDDLDYENIILLENAYLKDEPCYSINNLKYIPKNTELNITKEIVAKLDYDNEI